MQDLAPGLPSARFALSSIDAPRNLRSASREDEAWPNDQGGSAMPQLNPQMAEILALNAAAMKDRPARVSLSPVEARAQMNATFEAFWNADRPTLWAVYNYAIPGPQGALRVHPYDPECPDRRRA
jgi:hypothetical protein